ncbi:uncharacterized protein BJ212DRAFT_1298821 [Suillus subaureus]|uniref:Uncharacterized protein n=1 Tax=Suillus subaureus TaxID=48587 RepID=A0A9P7ED97_9AGAM|nr:uncharacterized protein BJ212DRAFT_1298821 [Suillus subaureus]KAG1817942.1 hypothetical protein BJ212DRAFT_1298821 [Suillus subaureus]
MAWNDLTARHHQQYPDYSQADFMIISDHDSELFFSNNGHHEYMSLLIYGHILFQLINHVHNHPERLNIEQQKSNGVGYMQTDVFTGDLSVLYEQMGDVID